MSGPELVVAFSYLGAAGVGGGLGALAAAWVTRTQRRIARSVVRAITKASEAHGDGETVGAGDREAEAMLNAHVTAVRYQVERFADALAAGDPVLRSRLRHLEQQMGRGR